MTEKTERIGICTSHSYPGGRAFYYHFPDDPPLITFPSDMSALTLTPQEVTGAKLEEVSYLFGMRAGSLVRKLAKLSYLRRFSINTYGISAEITRTQYWGTLGPNIRAVLCEHLGYDRLIRA